MLVAVSVFVFGVAAAAAGARGGGWVGGRAAGDPPPGGEKGERGEREKGEKPPAVTYHSVEIGGAVVHYKATAGTLPVLGGDGKAKANIFYVAYEKQGGAPDDPAAPVVDRASRPITFAFNGGPGSSSVWLHMGALGPRRVDLGAEGFGGRQPAGVVANPHAWLDLTDVVFIDPVSTGYSRAVEGEDPKQFHGLDEDARAVGDFIRLYLVRNERWGSPKFLAGESYGTTRASALAADMQGRLGVYLAGVVLISPVLNFQTVAFDAGNDTPYWLFLPTYTATAFFHGKLPPELSVDLGKTLEQAREWSKSAYLSGLAAGDTLDPAARAGLAAELAAFTGLSPAFVERCDLRPTIGQFTKELLRDKQRTVGRLDSRYSGIDGNAVGERPEYDPSYAAIQGPYTAALNAYVRGELKYESDTPYEVLTGAVQPWRYPAQNRYANVAESLRAAMSQNPRLRVWSASGYFDLATPFFAMEWTVSHMGLDPAQRGRVTQTYYESGHMMYVREKDLAQLKADAAAFYKGCLEEAVGE